MALAKDGSREDGRSETGASKEDGVRRGWLGTCIKSRLLRLNNRSIQEGHNIGILIWECSALHCTLMLRTVLHCLAHIALSHTILHSPTRALENFAPHTVSLPPINTSLVIFLDGSTEE